MSVTIFFQSYLHLSISQSNSSLSKFSSSNFFLRFFKWAHTSQRDTLSTSSGSVQRCSNVVQFQWELWEHKLYRHPKHMSLSEFFLESAFAKQKINAWRRIPDGSNIGPILVKTNKHGLFQMQLWYDNNNSNISRMNTIATAAISKNTASPRKGNSVHRPDENDLLDSLSSLSSLGQGHLKVTHDVAESIPLIQFQRYSLFRR